MTAATPNFIGAAGGVDTTLTDQRALYLKMFAGEILGAFDEYNIMSPLHTVKEISTGREWQWPATGRATGEYHVPGEEILGGDIENNEQIIYVDGKYISPMFLAEEDTILAHADLRGEYAKQMGEALSTKFDRQIAIMLAKAARASNPITGLPGGYQLNKGATVTTDAAVLEEAFWEAAQRLDENFVPKSDRYAILAPAQYYLLLRGAKDFIDRDLSAANGDYAKGLISTAAGFKIMVSTHIPSTNIVANDARQKNDYTGDFTPTKALLFHKSAVASVRRMGIKLESEYDIRRQGTLYVAKMMVGSGILRPDAAVEVTNTP